MEAAAGSGGEVVGDGIGAAEYGVDACDSCDSCDDCDGVMV
jgi:hypothetical protein